MTTETAEATQRANIIFFCEKLQKNAPCSYPYYQKKYEKELSYAENIYGTDI